MKKLIMISGGSGANGDPRRNLHWRGFPGMEKTAVDEITA